MRDIYSHSFTLDNGVSVFVPSENGIARGTEISEEVRE